MDLSLVPPSGPGFPLRGHFLSGRAAQSRQWTIRTSHRSATTFVQTSHSVCAELSARLGGWHQGRRRPSREKLRGRRGGKAEHGEQVLPPIGMALDAVRARAESRAVQRRVNDGSGRRNIDTTPRRAGEQAVGLLPAAQRTVKVKPGHFLQRIRLVPRLTTFNRYRSGGTALAPLGSRGRTSPTPTRFQV